MKYKNIVKGSFVSRPNRFVAIVQVEGREVFCHVKNTGRCKELLILGARVLLEKAESAARKTCWDLVAVYKGSRLINMDSSAPNKAAAEFLPRFFPDISLIRPEQGYKDSRFDFYIEHGDKKAFIEVKGVTLEEEGVVRFPDAPTLRGVKHLNGLTECLGDGYEAYVLLVVQMEGVLYFTPNDDTQPEFGQALKKAKSAGVKILCYDCVVTEDSMDINKPVKVKL